jgi:hypothetical protein
VPNPVRLGAKRLETFSGSSVVDVPSHGSGSIVSLPRDHRQRGLLGAAVCETLAHGIFYIYLLGLPADSGTDYPSIYHHDHAMTSGQVLKSDVPVDNSSRSVLLVHTDNT